MGTCSNICCNKVTTKERPSRTTCKVCQGTTMVFSPIPRKPPMATTAYITRPVRWSIISCFRFPTCSFCGFLTPIPSRDLGRYQHTRRHRDWIQLLARLVAYSWLVAYGWWMTLRPLTRDYTLARWCLWLCPNTNHQGETEHSEYAKENRVLVHLNRLPFRSEVYRVPVGTILWHRMHLPLHSAQFICS